MINLLHLPLATCLEISLLSAKVCASNCQNRYNADDVGRVFNDLGNDVVSSLFQNMTTGIEENDVQRYATVVSSL